MDYIWGFISGLAAAYWGYQWYKARKLPYRWSCPEEGCVFEVKSSGLKSLDTFASSHERSHL